MPLDARLARAQSAIVTAGDARGFVVNAHLRCADRVIVTAAHCLRLDLLPWTPGAWNDFRYSSRLVAPLGVEKNIVAEVFFVDPLADVALLAPPDNQIEEFDSDAFEALVSDRRAVHVARLEEESDAFLYTLDGQWEPCRVRPNQWDPARRTVALVGADAGNVAGCSGSPIVLASGAVVGLISIGSLFDGVPAHVQYGQPHLAAVLPAWFFARRRRAPLPPTWNPAA